MPAPPRRAVVPPGPVIAPPAPSEPPGPLAQPAAPEAPPGASLLVLGESFEHDATTAARPRTVQARAAVLITTGLSGKPIYCHDCLMRAPRQLTQATLEP